MIGLNEHNGRSHLVLNVFVTAGECGEKGERGRREGGALDTWVELTVHCKQHLLTPDNSK